MLLVGLIEAPAKYIPRSQCFLVGLIEEPAKNIPPKILQNKNSLKQEKGIVLQYVTHFVEKNSFLLIFIPF